MFAFWKQVFLTILRIAIGMAGAQQSACNNCQTVADGKLPWKTISTGKGQSRETENKHQDAARNGKC